MDLEMAIDNDYHEVIDMLDGMFIKLFQGIQANQRHLLEVVRRQFPSEDLVVPDKTVRLTFKEAVDLINESGFTEDGEKLSEYEDFSTPAEKHLGKLVKEKYHTDYYIVDKFPASVRPFYTMPDPDNPKLSNSADFFIRGQEVLSGGQRIHHAPMLEKRMIEAKIDPKEMVDYLDGFRWGCPPHGGGGIGLERVLFLYLDLQNVRWASLLPRDPKSFPEDTKPHGGKAIRGPEVDLLEWDTQRRRGENAPMPSVEDLSKLHDSHCNQKVGLISPPHSRIVRRRGEYCAPRSQLGGMARRADRGCHRLQAERGVRPLLGQAAVRRQPAQGRARALLALH